MHFIKKYTLIKIFYTSNILKILDLMPCYYDQCALITLTDF